jgi:hypothetical protein
LPGFEAANPFQSCKNRATFRTPFVFLPIPDSVGWPARKFDGCQRQKFSPAGDQKFSGLASNARPTSCIHQIKTPLAGVGVLSGRIFCYESRLEGYHLNHRGSAEERYFSREVTLP